MSMLAKAALFVPAFFAITALCVCLQRRRARRHGEWNYLTPGPYYWFGLCSGLMVSSVATLVVAGGRAGGREGVLIAFFFVMLTIFLAICGIFCRTRWNSRKIIGTTALFQTREMGWNELARSDFWLGQHWISSFDGPKLWLSPDDNGYEQLAAKIRRHLPKNPRCGSRFSGGARRTRRRPSR